MKNRIDLKEQKKTEHDGLLYVIRRVARKQKKSTWKDVAEVYNHLTTDPNLKRSQDGLRSRYQLLEKNYENRKEAIEEEIKQAKWIEKEKEIQELLETGVPHVC
jgi:hypothetical protein